MLCASLLLCDKLSSLSSSDMSDRSVRHVRGIRFDCIRAIVPDIRTIVPNTQPIENTKINEKYIHNYFLLHSIRFKKGQHLASMIQNVVFFNSPRQPAKICPIQINTSTKLQRYLC
jgi:hypothetical protein